MRRLRALALLALPLACASPRATESHLPDDETWRLMEEAQAAADRGESARALALMEQAASTGQPEAINALAIFVNRGIGGLSDPERARALFEEAVSAGSVGARLNLGLGLAGSSDPAEQQRSVALLSPLYEHPPDDEGRDTVRRLAAGGLGMAYLFGAGVEQDLARGVDLLEEADEAGDAQPDVVFLLGRSYESGWGGRDTDPARAIVYFRRAAEAGYPPSQWRWGIALLEGARGERDAEAAHVWVRRSAEAGYTRGEISTAVMLATGQGVDEDDARARQWYQRAVEKNSAHALRGLGFMLIAGEGGPRDVARGLAYVRLAADAGDEIARENLPRVDASAEERAEAEAIQAEWLREHGPPGVE